jgi:hypothetical protein
MRLQILRDVHLEISKYKSEVVNCDVIVLAGDIDRSCKGDDTNLIKRGDYMVTTLELK